VLLTLQSDVHVCCNLNYILKTYCSVQIKFANDKPAGENNCLIRNMRRNGDHVIGVFAATDLKKHDELTFDYGYDQQFQRLISRQATTANNSTATNGKNKR
jgi:SET domain-containing protein